MICMYVLTINIEYRSRFHIHPSNLGHEISTSTRAQISLNFSVVYIFAGSTSSLLTIIPIYLPIAIKLSGLITLKMVTLSFCMSVEIISRDLRRAVGQRLKEVSNRRADWQMCLSVLFVSVNWLSFKSS